MAGILVAYHNTEHIFGLQFFRASEMEKYISGGPFLGRIFDTLVRFASRVLTTITQDFSHIADDISVICQADPESGHLNIFAEALKCRKSFCLVPLKTLVEKAKEEGNRNQKAIDRYCSNNDRNRMYDTISSWTKEEFFAAAQEGLLARYTLSVDSEDMENFSYKFERDWDIGPFKLADDYMKALEMMEDKDKKK
jgi:hypothetical protein